MKIFIYLLCILSLTNCAPSNDGKSGVLGLDEATPYSSHDIEACVPTPKKLADSVAPSQVEDIDPNYTNYIIKYKTHKDLLPSGHTQREYAVASMNMKLMNASVYTLQIKGTPSEKFKMLTALSQQSDVEYVEPDYPIFAIPQTPTAEPPPDDPYFSKQWFHKTMNSVSAWSINDGSPELVVAVVDTGVDYNHPDLNQNMWINPDETMNGKDDDGNGYIDDVHGWNFAANSNDPRSTSTSPHGSHVAGLIGAAGNNHLGVIGVAPKVKMMTLKFMDDSGSGATSNAVKAIEYAIKKKVFLINNSWGSNRFSRTLSDVITRAANAGILFFAAAGNGNKGIGYDITHTAWYPASYSQWNVFTIAATTAEDQLTKFSNYSKTKVDVAAPGYGIYSTVSGTNYQSMSGTSMATPIVSGLAVLIKATNPDLEPQQILKVLRDSTDKIDALKEKTISGGRVNAYNAVLMANASQSCASSKR